MDTKLKKSKSNKFTKTVAIILIISMFTFVSGLASMLFKDGERRQIIKNIIQCGDYETTVARVFHNRNEEYFYNLETLADKYGDGSKAAFEERKSNYSAATENAKADLIYHIKEHAVEAKLGYDDISTAYIYKQAMLNYVALEPIEIENLRVENYAGIQQVISLDDLNRTDNFEPDRDIYYTSRWDSGHDMNDNIELSDSNVPKEVKKIVKEKGYDDVICLNTVVYNDTYEYEIYEETAPSTTYHSGAVIEEESSNSPKFYRGFYGIKINTDKIAYEMGEQVFLTYDEFKSDRERWLYNMENNFTGVNFVAYDSDRNFITTNIKGINKNSTQKDIVIALKGYDLILKKTARSENLEILKGDYSFVYEENFSNTNYDYYIGYKFTGDNAFINELKSDYVQNYDFIYNQFGLLILSFISAILIFIIIASVLVAKTGRKKNDENLYMHPLDKMFVELRLLIDGGIVAGAGCLLLVLLDPLSHILTLGWIVNGLYFAVCINAAIFALLDFILYCARNFKNHSFFTRFILIWLFNNILRKTVQFFINSFSKMRKRYIYVGDAETTVKRKTLLVVAINLAWGFFATGIDDWFATLLLFFPLFVFDLYILYRGLRFVGSTTRLFRAVKEIRNGNEKVKIDMTAIPEEFHETAKDLLSINDGIQIAVEKAMQNEKMKTELITNVSHDLKTPLTSIINYVDLLQKCEIEDETAKSYLSVLSEKSDRLKHLIEDLVEASKASSGAINVSLMEISLKEFINQLVGEHEEMLKDRNLSVVVNETEEEITVKADSNLLYRVLENLIVNVKKYAMENTRVYISTQKEEKSAKIIIKNISSAPLNMSPEELKSRFVRGDSSRSTSGNGLGLSIAENLCQLMNGKLDLAIDGDLFTAIVEMPTV